MRSLWLQIRAVAAMNVKSLPDRPWSSASAVGAMTLTVLVLLGFLSVSAGIQATVAGSGSDRVALILHKGAPDEASSRVARDSLPIIATAPQLARRGDTAIISPERFVVSKGARRGSGEEANLSLRGIGRFGLQTRPTLKLVQGRMFSPGSDEMIVGRAMAKTFAGFDVGKRIRVGGKSWKVVGIFEDGGGVTESEALVDIDTLQSFYGGGDTYQLFRALLNDDADAARLQAFIDADKRLDLTSVSERAHLTRQASSVGVVLRGLAWPLAFAMAVGALLGATNAMYSSVDARRREIATLRAIGFSPLAAFMGTLAESLAIALLGAAVGSLIALVVFQGLSGTTMGANFTQVVYRFRLGPGDLARALTLALLVGGLGGLSPAWRAARMPVTGMLQE